MHPEYDKEQCHRRATYLQRRLTTWHTTYVHYWTLRNTHSTTALMWLTITVQRSQPYSPEPTTPPLHRSWQLQLNQWHCCGYQKGIISRAVINALISHHQPLQDICNVWMPGRGSTEESRGPYRSSQAHTLGTPCDCLSCPSNSRQKQYLTRIGISSNTTGRNTRDARRHIASSTANSSPSTNQHNTLPHAIHPVLY